MMHSKRIFCLLAGWLLVFSLACGLFDSSATTTDPTPTETPDSVAETSAGVIETPVITTEAPPADAPSAGEMPATTDVPDVIAEGGCTLQAAFVADITIPDDTVIAPGEAFQKTWRVRNSGTCTWEAGGQMVFVSEEPLNGPPSVPLGAAGPNDVIDISVEFHAPVTPGTYRSNWQLQTADGTRFGATFYVRIVVAAAEPTTTPTEAPTPEPVAEAGPPDLIVANLEIDTNDPRQGVPVKIIATLRNNGESAAENVHWAWRVCTGESCAFTEAPGAFTLNPGQQVIASLDYTFGGWATYTTEAWVDSRGEIAESNEDNNRRQLVIPVKPGKPDLVITNVIYNPQPPVQNQAANIRVVIKNQGSQDAGAFKAEWWSSVSAPDPRCTWNVSGGLAAGESKTLTCNYTYPSWYAAITTRTVVDVENVIDELDETNNQVDIQTAVHKP